MSEPLKPDDDDEVLGELGYRVKRMLGRGTYAKVLLAELVRLSEEPVRLRPDASAVGGNSGGAGGTAVGGGAPGTAVGGGAPGAAGTAGGGGAGSVASGGLSVSDGGTVVRKRSPAARPYPQLACKVIDTTNAPRDYVRNFLPRELEILGQVHHPHIVHIHSIWQRRAKYFIFMRFAERGDLLDYVLKNGAVAEEQARIWMRQVSLAVQYLHEMDVAHRDLKCENILISINYNAKLADFGFARRVVNANGMLVPSTTYCGSLAYAPPEIIEGKPYNPKAADVWSLGVVLFVILNKALPFDTSSAKKQHLQQVTRDWRFRSKVVPLLSEQVKALAAEMLEPVTSTRPSIDQVLQSPFFAMEPRMRSLTMDEASALQAARDYRMRRSTAPPPRQTSSKVLSVAAATPVGPTGPAGSVVPGPPDLQPLQPPVLHDASLHSHLDPNHASRFNDSGGTEP